MENSPGSQASVSTRGLPWNYKHGLLYQFLLCGGTDPTPRAPPNADSHLMLISLRDWEPGGKDHHIWILQGHTSL